MDDTDPRVNARALVKALRDVLPALPNWAAERFVVRLLARLTGGCPVSACRLQPAAVTVPLDAKSWRQLRRYFGDVLLPFTRPRGAGWYAVYGEVSPRQRGRPRFVFDDGSNALERAQMDAYDEAEEAAHATD